MSYIVLARKWRPKRFEDVIGQEHITRTLVNALAQGRIAHAFIFAGPRGVGKTTTARLLAKAVNGIYHPEDDRSENQGLELDIIEIDGASNRGIDEIRNLRENVRFAPVSFKYKVYIIDEVHMLSKDAFNALLKTLEEPPSHVIFIFATTEIHRVPLTILSRCQRFDFRRIPATLIAGRLQKIAETEKISTDQESLLMIARKADGSMRDATSILDQLSAFTTGTISIQTVQESLGLINEELFFEFTGLLRRKDDGEIIRFARQVFEKGHDLMHFIHGLEDHFRNLLVTRATGSTKLLETSDFFKNLYQEEAASFAENDLLHYLDILTQNEALLKFSENPLLVLEILLLKLLHKPLSVELEELLTLLRNFPGEANLPDQSSGEDHNDEQRTGEGEDITLPKVQNSPGLKPPEISPTEKKSLNRKFAFPQNFAPPVPPPTSSRESSDGSKRSGDTPITLAEVEKNWDRIIGAVRKEKIALASFLEDGVPRKLLDNKLQIAFDPKTGFHMDHVRKNASTIERILQNEFNMALKIHCEKVDFKENNIQRKIQTPEEIFENIKNKEPVLKKIIDLFDCENLE